MKTHCRWLVAGIVAGALALPLQAQDVDTAGVDISFDDILDEPPPPSGLPGWVEKIHISGRFDLNLEVTNPLMEDTDQQGQLKNYHKFVFLKVTPAEGITLDAEILDLSYYEIRMDLPKDFQIGFGKIWVPFGATPFHHYYGGRQGDPFSGLFVPNVWSEFGAYLNRQVYADERVSVDADVFAIKGFANTLGSVARFNGGGSDGLFAVGGRAKLGLGRKIAAWGSALYNEFGADNEGKVFMWGGDLLVDYGLLDVPVLRNLRFRGAFVRAEVKDELLVDPDNNSEGWYFRYGDYAELTYRGLPHVQPRLRYGTIVDMDDLVSNLDSHNWDLALMGRLHPNVLALAQWQLNLEEVDEIDNDLFRVQLIFEF